MHVRDAVEGGRDPDDERAELVAVSVAWWDGVLTGLRARKLEANDPSRYG
jgi:hypothetical protein